MEKNILDMIHEFTEAEKKRAAMEAELFTPIILGEFVRVTGSRKTGPWTLSDVTEADLAAYRVHSAKEGLGKYAARLSSRTLARFFEYAFECRWIEKKPWDRKESEADNGNG